MLSPERTAGASSITRRSSPRSVKSPPPGMSICARGLPSGFPRPALLIREWHGCVSGSKSSMSSRMLKGSARCSSGPGQEELSPADPGSARHDCAPDRKGLARLGDIVNPQDLDTLLNRRQGSGERAGQTRLGRFAAAEPGDRRFARHAEDEGAAERMKGADPGEELEIMRHELAEPDPRMDESALTRDSGHG